MLIRNRDTNLSDICEEINGLNVRVTAIESVTGFREIFALPNPFIKRVWNGECNLELLKNQSCYKVFHCFHCHYLHSSIEPIVN